MRSAWESEGSLTGLATVVLEPERQQVANAVVAAAEGDFRTAAASGVKALSVGVSTGIAIGKLGAVTIAAIQDARPVRNGHLAGQAHPVTGAPFDADGFPDFKAVDAVPAAGKRRSSNRLFRPRRTGRAMPQRTAAGKGRGCARCILTHAPTLSNISPRLEQPAAEPPSQALV